MKIGITEQGDAGLNFEWCPKLQSGLYDGAVLITKNANAKFIQNVMTLYQTFKNIVLHIGCTGLGGTFFEPHVPEYTFQLNAIQQLLNAGFPAENIVLRVDPIIPTKEGLERIKLVLDGFTAMDTPITRVKFSFLDEYKHVKERLKNAGFPTIYDGFYPPKYMQENAEKVLAEYPNLQFESCAEDYFTKFSKLENVTGCGCISSKELELFGLHPDKVMSENMQKRTGCHCLSCKTELLSDKFRCPHQCIYCYWRDKK